LWAALSRQALTLAVELEEAAAGGWALSGTDAAILADSSQILNKARCCDVKDFLVCVAALLCLLQRGLSGSPGPVQSVPTPQCQQ
jgi:hypothetical protein